MLLVSWFVSLFVNNCKYAIILYIICDILFYLIYIIFGNRIWCWQRFCQRSRGRRDLHVIVLSLLLLYTSRRLLFDPGFTVMMMGEHDGIINIYEQSSSWRINQVRRRTNRINRIQIPQWNLRCPTSWEIPLKIYAGLALSMHIFQS